MPRHQTYISNGRKLTSHCGFDDVHHVCAVYPVGVGEHTIFVITLNVNVKRFARSKSGNGVVDFVARQNALFEHLQPVMFHFRQSLQGLAKADLVSVNQLLGLVNYLVCTNKPIRHSGVGLIVQSMRLC